MTDPVSRAQELQEAVHNINLDLERLEQRYQMSSEGFYQQFVQGHVSDDEDGMLWAGLYEMLQKNKKELTVLANQ